MVLSMWPQVPPLYSRLPVDESALTWLIAEDIRYFDRCRSLLRISPKRDDWKILASDWV
jgi:hypothetical protein